MDAGEARIYIAVIITVGVLGIIIFYFAISIIRQHRRNSELQKANTLAEITAMEKERARIAADLHDDLGPILSVIKFQVDNVETITTDEKVQLQKASVQIDQLIERLREVANNLMPSALKRKGLIIALEEFIAKVSELKPSLKIIFDWEEKPPIDHEKSIHIFRMMQEIIHNCIRHSAATQLKISFDQQNNMLMILCRDNGNGFDIEHTIKESAGIGLRSLKNRAELIGGTLTLESKKGIGTALLIELPLK